MTLALALAPAILRAVFELAKARRQFGRLAVRDLAQRNAHFNAAPAEYEREQTSRIVDLIPRVIPRVAQYMPWRSDCLVQAMAAQNWLGCIGQPSTIVLGAKKDETADNGGLGEFGAHAWLRRGDQVIIGGDISQYTSFLDEN
ncbi:MAG: lasso peptide biosynthesis B2 protein [Marinomonas sp.]